MNHDTKTDTEKESPAEIPLGLGIGAAGGGIAGAAAGSAIGGPIGAAVGALCGGLLGAASGHGIARAVKGDAASPDLLKSANRECPVIGNERIRVPHYCAGLALPWDDRRPFTERGWHRLSGVIAPRDTDRGLRGGI